MVRQSIYSELTHTESLTGSFKNGDLDPTIKNYENLAIAIIKDAIEMITPYLRHCLNSNLDWEVEENWRQFIGVGNYLEFPLYFFKSDYYNTLINLDYRVIIEQVQKSILDPNRVF